MSAYTVSRLTLDAGVSVYIVRDYLLRGLLRPVACTTGGYGSSAQLAVLRQLVERRREALASLEMQLAAMPTEPALHAESLP
ncbi:MULTISPECIES: MerR family transcriptional regulator [Betaproteobacteria]|uniref:MerR family transcriptional regulator n=3 Tax=Betaproteobacteria TaxID=28216 RepID=A0A2N4UCL5_9BURK|nr:MULTISPECIES: MerR family transcriptional regulator [Betaproteobacteria]ABI58319.1 transcriptional regulator, MerR family protein [Nitrosomonas eutropha C91]PLC52752.1 MerR family transcriptional regulator [Pollutimonas nitritireducens]PXV84139.1 MerR family mercuric resistance operon transcriptional regulator [Nitrosomonas eutropha]